MNPTSGLTVGHIPYLNCVPFFYYLKESGFCGKLVSGVPSALNQMLQQGTIDISPSSSFEYARNWQDYLLLPEHSISSLGPVRSVLLFSPVELSDLEGELIAVTGESATSINLLRIILREFSGLTDVRDAVPDEPVESMIAQRRPALLIGDRALRLVAEQPAGMRIFDLGEIWHQHTGLPFVFALWMIRRDSLGSFATELSQLSSQLHCSIDRALAAPRHLAETVAGSAKLPPEKIVEYWRSIDYCLSERHLEGLRLFFKLCVKQQLLAQQPPLEFFQSTEIARADLLLTGQAESLR